MKTFAKIFDELKGFNRYMVECECVFSAADWM